MSLPMSLPTLVILDKHILTILLLIGKKLRLHNKKASHPPGSTPSPKNNNTQSEEKIQGGFLNPEVIALIQINFVALLP